VIKLEAIKVAAAMLNFLLGDPQCPQAEALSAPGVDIKPAGGEIAPYSDDRAGVQDCQLQGDAGEGGNPRPGSASCL